MSSAAANGDASLKAPVLGLAPEVAQSAVRVKSESMPSGTPVCRGYDFNQGVDLSKMLQAAFTTGFQATNLALAIDEVRRMREWRLSHRPVTPDTEDELRDPEVRANAKCTIFLSYTSNMISCGLREVIRFLVQHKMVDCIVTTAGGVEEDLIKCLKPTYLGDFGLNGRELRLKGINRIGNLLVPNENYCSFEDWIKPILMAMTDEQAQLGRVWTPSSMIARLGQEINNEDSVYYWCWKHGIPVFCPALTDGSIGDMIYFHKYKRPEFMLDVTGDIKSINDIAVRAHATGMIVLGGGVVKHHTCNANLMRNGAEFSVFINTGSDFDGSDSGAKPDEAISWGKVKIDSRPVKLQAEATLVFPLIVAETFAKDFHASRTAMQQQQQSQHQQQPSTCVEESVSG
ncbi:DHS-like NAD/FAD-binding domain-containing protein [Tribonema minus]|uniref:deoxyhypusine synthase n=1 Tax=Tribonema minus TaxID=303371 RepID=A0A835YZK5_9STRA|nr:DHS-like NAD/FAD-binding domain-containing protein [Tribonema minus]